MTVANLRGMNDSFGFLPQMQRAMERDAEPAPRRIMSQTVADRQYEPGSPKRSDYREPQTCVFCIGRNRHYEGCAELT